MAYGEDKDLRERIAEHDFDIKNIDFNEKRKVVSSLKEVFNQGKWYGKSYLNFVRKYPSEIDSLIFTLYFISLPFLAFLSYFSIYVAYFFALEVVFFLYLCLECLRLGSSYHAFFVPLIRFVRSIGMGIGMVKGLFTRDWGKAS